MRNASARSGVQRIAAMCSMLPVMTRPVTAHGPGSVAVAYNVRRRRNELDMSGTELRDRLSAFGLTVHRSWVSEVENRKRTVDVDELLCLAAALTISPSTLLMPRAVTPEDVVPTVSGPRDARDVWDWIAAERSLGSSWIDADDEAERRRYRAVARPPWVAFAESAVEHGAAVQVSRDVPTDEEVPAEVLEEDRAEAGR